ncbi:pyridoxamine 5'-phosphate oxidase family protein [Roseovarius rhodophyticola]|uniref:Pyridoxamine 5'-phosphate oxidase family protein n=1 Tax=Roseovarius rhodophyticola TaxID=3080827 RepID=A0ABZ2TK62_9RHOB|nr:pyridoxamine 5'-phosphate oxidase family protein [Roseovarius sp. W115]MDV2927928.1 pyridoxamine 5'-phosphate oxidase family protein [Roseovarius sp. W115]
MTPEHFHEGELRLQEQTGDREKIAVMTRHLMNDFMPDQHRAFFEGLEYIFLGTVDAKGLPHASIMTGSVGFASSPGPKTLVIQTGDRAGTPAFDALDLGQAVGVVGLDLSNQRRNRMHGKITDLDDVSVTITVVQSYGNCPKYINLREISEREHPIAGGEFEERDVLNAYDTSLIKAADTFLIASYVQDGSGAPYEGVDVNHRGGQPGFVSVDSPSQITIPDYRGNNLFNTFGNLLLNPDAGLLFVDFKTGDQLHLHGKASLIKDADEVAQTPGALRLLRIQISGVRRTTKATPLRWTFVEHSPVNPDLTPEKD